LIVLLGLCVLAIRCQNIYVPQLFYGGNFSYVPVLPVIFGMDFLGWGFDATYRDTFFALKPQLFRYTYNDNPQGKEKSYRYPTDTQTYAVPDQVFVRTVAKTDTFTYLFTSTSQRRTTLDLRLAITASTQQINGEIDFGLNTVSESDVNQRIVSNFAETGLFQLYLSTKILSADFLSDLNGLAATYTLDPESYNLFLAKWGTHYVDSVVIGGSINQETTITVTNDTDAMTITAALRGQFEQASGTGPKVNLDLTLAYQTATSYVQTSTFSSAEIYGGDPEFTDFVLTGGDVDATKLLFESWKASLITNPITIRYRLVELWELLEGTGLTQVQMQVCTAIATVLGFLPDQDKTYCSKVSNVLDGTVQGGLSIK